MNCMYMKITRYRIVIAVLAVAMSSITFNSVARDPIGKKATKPRQQSRLTAACVGGTSSTDLDINNVRAKLLAGGDFWWDNKAEGSAAAGYEIPKVEAGTGIARHSIYSGALWFGGMSGSNLRTAGQTYGTGNNNYEFWPGPLDTTNATIDGADCTNWDKHFKVNRTDIDAFLLDTNDENLRKVVRNWPGYENKDLGFDANGNVTHSLAPFIDVNKNGKYDGADYPDFRGDQAIWWVFNDKGDIHGQYKGDAIGLEVQALAFAFKTNDVLNNMTFYNYKVVNRALTSLDSTFMGVFVDADLGDYFDDYVGCDAELGVGFIYNGDDNDGTNLGYGENPPALGIDFFKGPINEFGVELPMSRFMYFNNSPDGSDPQSDPGTDVEMYRYLNGNWKDGTKLSYGATGYKLGSTNVSNFAFPGKTDPKKRFEWTEAQAGNTSGDRRFLLSAGPFKLLPGAVNNIIIGVVWARASSGGAQRSLLEMLDADSKAQALFNAGFRVANGPRTPDVQVTELDQRIVLSLANTKITESYDVIEPTGAGDFRYKFEGYQVFQLKDNTVTVADIYDINRAKPLFQCDLKNGIRTIVNKDFSTLTGETNSRILVEGADKGIVHTFDITKDAFNNNAPLANNRPYYFVCIAYAYSKDARRDSGTAKVQYSYQYLAGRGNIPDGGTVAVPRKPDPREGGVKLNADIGTTPKVIRLSGAGNGANILEFTPETDLSPLFDASKNYTIDNPEYQNSKGPLTIKVYDPFKIPNESFTFYFTDDTYNAGGNKRWKLVSSSGDVVKSDYTLDLNYEQVIPQYGFSVSVNTITKAPGKDPDNNDRNGFLDASIEYPNGGSQWFQPLVNNKNGGKIDHWINEFEPRLKSNEDTATRDQDPNGFYRNVLEGRFAPYKFVANTVIGPGLNNLNPQANKNNNLNSLPSIDIVLLPKEQEAKWSKCVVVESGLRKQNNEGGVVKGYLRAGTHPTEGVGRGIFPGYAVNMETGQRLNIFYAESSNLTNPIAKDMLFNPNNDTTNTFYGGRHFIYVSNTPYDECKAIEAALKAGNNGENAPSLIGVYSQINWVTVAMADPDPDKFLEKEVRVRLRVAKPLVPFITATDANNGFPYYQFKTTDLAPEKGNVEIAKSALDLIRIVPNPYYGQSSYERSKTDTRARITNLPKQATISIYTLNGALVKRIEKDTESASTVDWDLQNENGVPVASGMYIIHIRTAVGEKSLKWFGVMSPTDLDNF